MYRQPEREKRALTESCIQAYRNIRHFIHANNSAMLNRYRQDPLRCMSLGIEIAKIWFGILTNTEPQCSQTPSEGLSTGPHCRRHYHLFEC